MVLFTIIEIVIEEVARLQYIGFKCTWSLTMQGTDIDFLNLNSKINESFSFKKRLYCSTIL